MDSELRIEQNVFNYIQKGFPKHNPKELSIIRLKTLITLKLRLKFMRKITKYSSY